MSKKVKVNTYIVVTLSIVALCILILSKGCGCKDGETRLNPKYIREEEVNSGVIVFVHGVMGDGTSTWTNSISQQYWPRLIADDPTFSGFNIYVYEYPSPLFCESLSIDEVTENMRLFLDNDHIFKHKEVMFLSHSMGGLVTRSFLNKYREYAPQVKMLYFFGTPTNGAEISSVASFVSRNPQYGKMVPTKSDNYLADQMRSWLAAELGIPCYCSYETQDTHGQKIVDMASASSLCTKPLNPIPANHIDIVKPYDTRASSYIAFKNAFEEVRPSIAINLPEGLNIESAIEAIVHMDKSMGDRFKPVFDRSCKSILTYKIRSGILKAVDRVELIKKLKHQLTDPTFTFHLEVTKNNEKKIYDIKCTS